MKYNMELLYHKSKKVKDYTMLLVRGLTILIIIMSIVWIHRNIIALTTENFHVAPTFPAIIAMIVVVPIAFFIETKVTNKIFLRNVSIRKIDKDLFEMKINKQEVIFSKEDIKDINQYDEPPKYGVTLKIRDQAFYLSETNNIPSAKKLKKCIQQLER